MKRLVNRVFHSDAHSILRALPDNSVDAIISDWMYGTAKSYAYSWGKEPSGGNAVLHWNYHREIYEESLRVLKPSGSLAIGQGAKHVEHFRTWFGEHRIWTLTRFSQGCLVAVGNVWVLQTKDRKPIAFPDSNSIISFSSAEYKFSKKFHPCPKPTEEMMFLIEHITKPGDLVLDCCCGSGSTLVAAKRLGRNWIGCDIGRDYCQVALMRLQLEFDRNKSHKSIVKP